MKMCQTFLTTVYGDFDIMTETIRQSKLLTIIIVNFIWKSFNYTVMGSQFDLLFYILP